MKSEEVFKKAAARLGVDYLGSARDGRYIFGYFRKESGDVVSSFYFPSIKDVVWAIGEEKPITGFNNLTLT